MTAANESTDPLRVVIIDDTVDLRELLRLALVRGGMTVVGEAGDGLAGIATVAECLPDVILLDLSMPVMDGLEALPQLRELVPEARIIVLSGFGATQMAERALQIGADGYLQKGSSLGRILDHIRDLVDGRPVTPVMRPVEDRPDEDRPAQDRQVEAPRSGSPGARIPGQRDADPDNTDSALAMAPFAVIEVGCEPPYRLVRMNPAARAMVGTDVLASTPLGETAPELATTITTNRLRGDIDFESSLAGNPVRVTLRHAGTSLFLYLHRITDEAGMLRSAIATTAHEIRGPVSVLCAIAETIADAEPGDFDDAERDRLMASVVRQAWMLDSITADLLTMAQIQRGMLRIDARPIPTGSVLEGVVQDRYPDSVTVVVVDPREVEADPIRLQQMIGNLLSNAHKYGAPPVVVRTRPSDDHDALLCIDVEDCGPGVPEEFHGQLFREFSRASGTRAAGTGLGLHVVHTLARAHGGSVAYRPRDGGGSVFTLTLPVASTAAAG